MTANSAGGRRGDDARLTVEGYRASVAAFPPGPYRDFCLWVLDQPDLRPRWLQLIGLEAVVRMTNQVMTASAPTMRTDAVAPYVAAMNVYQVFEIVSDNLAIGLAVPTLDAESAVRRRVLYEFNAELVGMLHASRQIGTSRPPWYAEAQQISGAAQSLAAAEHRSLADAYRQRCAGLVASRPANRSCERDDPRPSGVDVDELDRSIGPCLLSNRDTAASLLRMVADQPTAGYVRESLARRYAAVNRLLEQPPAEPAELVALGADTILVEPTLAYYCGVLGARLLPARAWGEAVAEALRQLLADAAVAVRLLNDIGPGLLEHAAPERADLLAALGPGATLRDSLLAPAEGRIDSLTTRLRKDARFDEFNVGLDGLRDEPWNAATRRAFAERLDYLADRYVHSRRAITAGANLLTARSGSRLLGDVVVRFVGFHRALYRHSFQSDAGEYAVPAARSA